MAVLLLATGTAQGLGSVVAAPTSSVDSAYRGAPGTETFPSERPLALEGDTLAVRAENGVTVHKAVDPVGWEKVDRLAPPESGSVWFGAAVSIGEDAIAVGDIRAEGEPGRVYIFEQVGPTDWAFDQQLEAPSQTDEYGFNLVLEDGLLGVSDWWKVYTYRQDEAGWTLDAEFDDVRDFSFGLDSQILALPSNSVSLNDAVRILERGSDGTWTEATWFPLPGTNVYATSIRVDGGTIAVSSDEGGSIDFSVDLTILEQAKDGSWSTVYQDRVLGEAELALDGKVLVQGNPAYGTATVWTEDGNGEWSRDSQLIPGPTGISPLRPEEPVGPFGRYTAIAEDRVAIADPYGNETFAYQRVAGP